MSQMVTRKTSTTDEKDKRQTDSPVKDMKKKLVVNLEREKTGEKPADKPADKEKTADKKAEKTVTTEKKIEKIPDKSTEKPEKNGSMADKEKKDSKDSKVEKKDAGDKSGVAEKKEDKVEKNLKPEKEKPKERSATTANASATSNANGSAKQLNGAKQNGCNGSPGSVSGDSSSDDVILVVDEPEDEFPELTYEESDEFEPPTPESGRSFTRRSQVKAARTPETPRPPSDKLEREAAADESKDSKILKLKEDANSDRKLRSSDAPKEDPKKAEEKKKDDGEKENGEKMDKVEIQVTVEVENEEAGEERQRRKEDTNYSKSRVKVSPYRRSMRLDQTASSMQANYTGNNTTMEMDITESSFAEEPSTDELSSSYLSAVRSMRGRRSYKQLKELNITRIPKAGRTPVPLPTLDSSRPTGTVVGRKRKPDADEAIEVAAEAAEGGEGGEVSGKRMRLLDRLARPFRPLRRGTLDSEIVGINTDLPLTTPIVSTETFDPETLKPSSVPNSVPLAPAAAGVPDRDGKRCVVM